MRKGLRKAVLIVEDEARRRRFFYDVLRLTRVDVLSASNGEEALQIVRHEQPELILLNLFSAKTNGLDFLKQLRCFGLGQKMIVLGMVGEEDDELRRAASKAGADKLLERRPVPHLILELVAGYLNIEKIEVPQNMVKDIGSQSVSAVSRDILERPLGRDDDRPVIKNLSSLLALTEDAGKDRS